MTTRERLDWLEAQVGTLPWHVIAVIMFIGALAIATAVCVSLTSRDLNDTRGDVDVVAEEQVRIKLALADLISQVESIAVKPTEFVGNFVGPEDYRRADTAEMPVQRPTPQPRPRIVPPATPGPTTDTKADAIDKGQQALIAAERVAQPGGRHRARQEKQ